MSKDVSAVLTACLEELHLSTMQAEFEYPATFKPEDFELPFTL